MHLSEELFRMHCSKEDQCMAVSAVGRLVASDVQQEAQAWVELESRRAEVMEGCAWSTTLLASGLADKLGEQDDE